MNLQSLGCVVAAMTLTITSKLSSGLPRQFWLMKLNSLCSILFHLLQQLEPPLNRSPGDRGRAIGGRT